MKYLIIQILDVYMIVILIRVVMSWMRVNQNSPFVRIVYNLTEPVLAPVRNVMPHMGGLDISPIVIFFAYRIIVRSIIIGL